MVCRSLGGAFINSLIHTEIFLQIRTLKEDKVALGVIVRIVVVETKEDVSITSLLYLSYSLDMKRLPHPCQRQLRRK